jgi:hypothetical protein
MTAARQSPCRALNLYAAIVIYVSNTKMDTRVTTDTMGTKAYIYVD